MPERRKYRRIKKRFLISYRRFAYDMWQKAYGTWELKFMDNLGAGGLLFFCEEKLDVGIVLELKLKLPISETPLHCTGRVLRIETTPPSKVYRVALGFVELVDQDKNRINRLAEGDET